MMIWQTAKRKLAGRKPDILGFVDALLAFCAEGNTVVSDFPEDNDAIVFRTSSGENVAVETDGAHGKWRAMCARLCVLSNEATPALNNVFIADSVFMIGGIAVRVQANNGVGNRFFRITKTDGEPSG